MAPRAFKKSRGNIKATKGGKITAGGVRNLGRQVARDQAKAGGKVRPGGGGRGGGGGGGGK